MAQAPGISLILIVATSLAAIVHFWKNQKVDWKLALVIDPPMDIAVATSTVMVALTALSGVVGHALHGQLDWRTGLILAVVAVIGGLTGSHISLSMNKARLKKVFGIVLWLIAIRILVPLLGLF